jgi:hypothetical protein
MNWKIQGYTFATAMGRWASAGFPVDAVAAKARLEICGGCDLWKRDELLKIMRCTHPQCGCTAAKAYLPTEACPLGKWAKTG